MKKVIIGSFFITLFALFTYQSFRVWILENALDVSRSQAQFFRIAYAGNCLKKGKVIEAANYQGWQYNIRERTDRSHFEITPTGTVYTVDVAYEPQIFLAPRSFMMFNFDENGCWISTGAASQIRSSSD